MLSKTELERLYKTYNKKKYVHPDPLEFLYNFPDIRDREIAGLIASSLAYGRVTQILKSVRCVLDKMGPSPLEFIKETRPPDFKKIYCGFKHRFTTHCDIADLLSALHRILKEYGSLNKCFVTGMGENDETVIPALNYFLEKLNCTGGYLIPLPHRDSACKRMHLFLRWMVRKDAVDPGGWKGISPGKLVVPLDTHMANIGRTMGMTQRKSANQGMALDITNVFRRISPDDPVKYDFALTRFGIHPDMEMKDLLKSRHR
ncbi:MAG: TIGR02757 family protein [Kiritimatiellae bacterium]|nr:TIGR02757 family protein [Kiritimatiellia bacterium]MDD5523078.1 TIGR02757 family protein [Kiritimatiellia bacterium]